jgi:hypothetical protein
LVDKCGDLAGDPLDCDDLRHFVNINHVSTIIIFIVVESYPPGGIGLVTTYHKRNISLCEAIVMIVVAHQTADESVVNKELESDEARLTFDYKMRILPIRPEYALIQSVT